MAEATTDRAFTAKDNRGIGGEYTFAGALSFMRRRYSKDLAGVDVAVTGVPFDLATTHRPGARFGPAAIRAASANLAWIGGPFPWGFDPFERLSVVDYGDCFFDHGTASTWIEAIRDHAAGILDAGASVLTLGGDHFVAYPLLQAHHAKYGPLSLIHFDAHSDTWREDSERIDHGTMFFHAAQQGLVDPARSVQIGLRTHNDETHGFNILDGNWVQENGPLAVIERVHEIVGDHQAYLTFDIDCLDPAYAPGTGTPVCGGLTSWQAQRILRGFTEIDLVGMDIVEVAPAYDVGEVTALAGATLAMEYLCLQASKRPLPV
ncbi:MAG: agmatinase [Rhodospirillaceae bacterium]|nr:agmatinase [Rhodospirillaceae bacterium]